MTRFPMICIRAGIGLASLLALSAISGCGGGQPAGGTSGAPSTAAASSSTDGSSAAGNQSAASPPKRVLQPVKLGSGGGVSVAASKAGGEDSISNVIDALRPLQVVIGDWRGVTRKPLDGAVKVEEPKWVWDLRTDRKQPALVYNADASPYFKSARITFLTAKQQFQLKGTDKEGKARVYEGTFTEPVQDVPGDDKKLHRTYKLTLKEVDPGDERKLVQVVFNQQENNRYLMEIYDKRGDGVLLVNTVANQREGTSFALNLDDYGEKKCVVSGGLGTSTVSHDGKTYYVCCSGCRAAFEDDPERWIAKFEASKKAQ